MSLQASLDALNSVRNRISSQWPPSLKTTPLVKALLEISFKDVKLDKADIATLVGISVLAGLFCRWVKSAQLLRWEWDNGAEEPQKRRVIDLDNLRFPENFLWGTATAAHQIDGDARNSNWTQWENQINPSTGKPTIANSDKSGKACDHWNRIPEDIALMKALHTNSYRCSIDWAKLEPEPGKFDQSVIDHYKYELTELKKAGLTTMVTLHHFTHPLWFENLGSWEKTENIAHFVAFSVRMYNELNSLVDYWCTINEPQILMLGGWIVGMFPPGKKLARNAGYVLRNLLDAHVQVYYALKALPSTKPTVIGLVNNITHIDPGRAWHPIDRFISYFMNRSMTEVVHEFFRSGHFSFKFPFLMSSVSHYDQSATGANDFIGLNYYSNATVRFNLSLSDPLTVGPPHWQGYMVTDMPYGMYPEGFYRAIYQVATLRKPIIITENGLADARDDRRARWIRMYLYVVSRAIAEGVDIRGFFYWSLMDNFEWAYGYAPKFGLYHVDLNTQKRTLRDGSKHYVAIIKKARGITASD